MTIDRNLWEEFLHPGPEYTPIPFWFWNDRLDKQKLLEQIEDFYEKGVEGFVLHPRIGIPKDIEYLSEQFMDYVVFAVEEAHKRNMQVILYDEAMYPSGAANGKVVELNPDYASRGLTSTVYSAIEFPYTITLKPNERVVAVFLLEKHENGYDPGNILTVFPGQETDFVMNQKDNVLYLDDKNQELAENQHLILLTEGDTEGTIRGIHHDQDDGQRNAPRSADLLNPEAVQAFIQITHERYKQYVGKYFGNTIIAMFTDEPDITGRNSKLGYLAWTRGFEHDFFQYGYHYSDLLSLFIDMGDYQKVRQDYERAINARMLTSYYLPIRDWCENNHIQLTGHPEKSDDIGLLKAFHIPGQDVVWRWVAPEEQKGIIGEHSTAGKCGADAARHYGRRRNINEYLGVCGLGNTWNLSAADMKWYTDWLAVRGVNLFCPHAFYYSVKGKERSHERPPDVGPNNVWWPYYSHFSKYIKRLSWLMTDSVNDVEIGILSLNNQLPWKMARYFYENQIEFNYIHEDLFDGKVKVKGNMLVIEKQQYTAIVLDELNINQLNSNVVNTLKTFMNQGGKVYSIPSYSDNTLKGIHHVPDHEKELRAIFSEYQKVKFESFAPQIRLTKVVKGTQFFYLFVNEGEKPFEGCVEFEKDMPSEAWNPWTGERKALVKKKPNSIYLQIGYRESIILTIGSAKDNLEDPVNLLSQHEIKLQLVPSLEEGYWQKNELKDWQKIRELSYYSGSIDYVFHFDWKNSDSTVALLDLGTVYEIAEVFINDQVVNVKMWTPYHYLLSNDSLKNGQNELLVRVTNNSAVAMDQKPQPSGLIGPVTLKVCKKEGVGIGESYLSSE